jgi:hypothetical protein
MKKYLVSVTQEVCADYEMEAETPESAVEKMLALKPRVLCSDDWCEGHLDTQRAHVVEELPGE